MTSVPGTDNLVWSDEKTRFYLQLRIEENLKGNIRNNKVNDAGRQNIITKFHETFGEKHTWIKFKNKFNTCKKQYASFKKLTHNRTGIGYDSNGGIDMSDDWWEDRCKEWPGARKFKGKSMPSTNLMETIFGGVHITGAEGWSAQQGENHLDDEEPINEDDVASEARQNASPPNENVNASVSNAPSVSNIPKASRKRRAAQAVADVIRDSIHSRDEILSRKNQLIESHPDFCCSQLQAMRVLHSLRSIRLWSPLYKAAMKHLKESATNRQTFLSYEDDENKVLYLEFETGERRDVDVDVDLNTAPI